MVRRKLRYPFAWLAVSLCLSTSVEAFAVLHSFSSAEGGAPWSPLVIDRSGNLYGTTTAGNGTVFKLAADGTFTTLYRFQGDTDGWLPNGSLVLDSLNNLYGITTVGGLHSCGINGDGCGTVFKIAPDGTKSIIYRFSGGADGDEPNGGVVADKAGDLFGTTAFGGSTQCDTSGCGTVFEVTPDGTETVLYAFKGGDDGAFPASPLLIDRRENLYGTTGAGGPRNKGTVFRVSSRGKKTTIYSFKGGVDGAQPVGGVLMDATGSLYGTTLHEGAYGGGTIFKIAPDGTETVLHSFAGRRDGYGPYGTLASDPTGMMYGTTWAGGRKRGRGTVFTVSPNGEESVLHAFPHDGSEGSLPLSGVTLDREGNLFGTTEFGGTYGLGVIYRLKP